MKLLITLGISLLIFLMCSNVDLQQNSDSKNIIQKDSTDIEKVDFEEFINKKVDILFTESFIKNKTYESFWINEPPGIIRGITLHFSNNYSLEVFIKTPKYIERFRKDLDWSIEEFKKEEIREIFLYKNDKLINNFAK